MKSGGGEKRPDLVVVELGGADSGGGVDTRAWCRVDTICNPQ